MIITTVRIQSLSTDDQSQVPFTFGQVFKAGDLAPTDGLKAGDLPLQVDVKAMHADGSVRHAVISGVLPKLKAGETAALQLEKAKASKGIVIPTQDPDGLDLLVTIDGVVYKSRPAEIGKATPWLIGPVACEWFSDEVLIDDQGNIHPLLTVRLGLRCYAGSSPARVEFIVENTKTFVTNRKYTYDVDCQLNGKSVYSKTGLAHYHRSRWHQYAWTGTAPQINIQLDPAYIVSTRAVPNYQLAQVPWTELLDEVGNKVGDGNTGPMTIGPITNYMPQTGGRDDIGSLPAFAVQWLLSMDARARKTMMAAADGSGTWSIHMRDENTGYPVRTDNPTNSTISTHGNISNTGPLAVPRYEGDISTPFAYDAAHEPSLAYLPYLVTGDYYYLEELQFWAASNPLETAPDYNGNGQGLVRWQQLRGQAWSMRTLGQVAYITPDEHPLKGYFLKQLDANLEYYNTSFVVNNPNNLGVYDGSGELAFKNEHGDISSWQDDFFTASIGYLWDLGFDKAKATLNWKAKYVVGRMMDKESCWIAAADYNRPLLDATGKVFSTFGEQYRATYGKDTLTFDNVQPAPSTKNGVNFLDLPCMSQAQGDFLTTYTGWTWENPRMFGYADFEMGYPANMQPALAAAVNVGYPGAAEAWALFDTRKSKPDYRKAPQWSVIPWDQANPWPGIAAPSAPANTAPAPSAKLELTSAPTVKGEWKRIAGENETVSLLPGSMVRYGQGDKWLYAKTTGDFVAGNTAFGSDPLPGKVKEVDLFLPTPAPVVPGKVKTGSNTVLKKLKALRVLVFDPQTMGLVRSVENLTASSTGVLTFSDASLTVGATYGLQVADASGKVLCFIWPVVATK